MFFPAHRTLRPCSTQTEVCIHYKFDKRMTNSLDEPISRLSSVVKVLESLIEAEEINLANKDSAWELLAKIEELFEVFDE